MDWIKVSIITTNKGIYPVSSVLNLSLIHI